ncbi:MAG: SUMF1/EgtB/PvdO family nonheme iron enzyme, partial [Gammaproteobacteria bacterium]|nr:SUMF1/EgtB/PvdO family nonheme iron enzyme [Gammaproteobacteria bacterium]
VKALLANGANPNARERRQQTALMWAAAEGHVAVVETLVDAEADFRTPLESGFTPLFFAAREGHADVVHALLEAGVDVNEALHPSGGPAYRMAREGTSPLLLAIENGHYELAIALVKAGADPNDARTGLTPLHRLSLVRKPDASDVGDPAPRGSGNLTSLQFARELVNLGANVNARLGVVEPCVSRFACGKLRGASPFLVAADRADAPYMELLLELRADPFLRAANNTTPLMAAAGLGTNAPIEEAGTETEALEVVELLLSLGAEVNVVNDNGETAMHGAAYGSFPSVVFRLAEHGADPGLWRKPNIYGWTPLLIAEGYRPGNFKPAPPTIEALHQIMFAVGIPTGGPRPRHIGGYEQARLAAEKKARQMEQFVPVSGGSFMMGSPGDEPGRADDEGPVHPVTVAAFAMAVTEVTREEFARFVADTGYVTDAEKSDGGCGGIGAREDERRDWREPGFVQTDDHPVVCVSRNDAVRYAAWFTRESGKRVRLPTEAEFEYALRAGGGTLYPWGEDGEAGCLYGNIGDVRFKEHFPEAKSAAACDDGYGHTAPVGIYIADVNGIKDLSGNVWEWTADCFHPNFQDAPTDGSAWIDDGCEVGVLRGASFDDGPVYQRSANRVAVPPSGGATVFGIRLVHDLGESL